MPARPAQGSTQWFSWAQAVHEAVAEVVEGRLTADALGAASGAWAEDETSPLRLALDGVYATTRAGLRIDNAIQEYAWTTPQAVFQPSPARTLYGAVASDGGIVVGAFEHLTGKTRRYVVGTTSPDDHNSPAISLGPAGHRTMVAWTHHNATHYVHYVLTGTSGDLSQRTSEMTLDFGTGVSYCHLIREDANPDAVWVLARVGTNGDSWRIVRGVIQAAGTITWGTIRTLVLFAGGDQGYLTLNHATVDGDQGVVIAVYGHPVNAALRPVYVGTINLVTGAVKAAGVVIGNVVDGTSLPLAPTAFEQAFDPGAGSRCRLFGVQGGDGLPTAVAVASWSTTDYVATYKHVRFQTEADPGLKIRSTAASVSTPSSAAMKPATLRFDMRFTPDVFPPSGTKTLAKRSVSTGNQRSWTFSITGAGNLNFVWSGDGVTNVTAISSSIPLPATTGVPISVRVELQPDDAGTRRLRFYYRHLETDAWALLGTERTSTTIVALFGGTAPLETGNVSGTSGYVGTIKSLALYSAWNSTTAVASQDFLAGGWPDGAAAGATDTDPQGNVWTITGDASVELSGWQISDFGNPGAVIGYTAATKYVAGMAYPIPGRGDVLFICREAAGTWTVEKWSRAEGGAWSSEILATSTTDKLARPVPIVGGGPLDILYSAISQYGPDYTTYAADVVGV